MMKQQQEDRAVVAAVAWAIAYQEGFYRCPAARGARAMPSVSQRLNNPLMLARWHDQQGVLYPTAYGFVDFPSVRDGKRAGRTQVMINVVKRRFTWRQFFSGKQGGYRGFCAHLDVDPLQYTYDIMNRLHVTRSNLDTCVVSTQVMKVEF